MRVCFLCALIFWDAKGVGLDAAAAATLAVGHQPKEYYYYHMLSPLLVITRNRAAYDPLCQKILATFTNTLNPYVAGRMAKGCLLWPGPAIDLRLIDQMADVAVTRGSGENALPSFQVCKAHSHYRQKQLAEAIAWAEKALSGSQVYVQAQACAVLAASHSRLGRPEQARTMLSKGNALAPDVAFVPGVENIGSDWLDWLIARIWLDEAAALIQSPASTPTEAEKQ